MLSVCLVAYNEEKIIARCLESVKNIADEIIVVLDGKCQDKTEEICLKYADKIFIRQHIGFSDPHLVFAFGKARGDWIMRIDADEFLLPETAEKIKTLMKNKNIDGYFFLWRLWNGKKYITKNKPHKPVLFRKSKLFFIGLPHGIMQTYGNAKKLDIPLEHQPLYDNWTRDMFKTKHINRIKLHADFLFNKFQDVEKYNFQGNNYPFGIRIRKSMFFMFPLFAIAVFFRSVMIGEKNREAIKVSFYNSFYELILGYFILLKNIKLFTTSR